MDVLPELTVDGHPHVYAVGDAANIPGADGSTLPQLGSVAQQSGRWAAENILRQLHGDALVPFRSITQGPVALYYTRDPEYAKIMQDSEKAMFPYVSINPTDGFYSPTYARKSSRDGVNGSSRPRTSG